LDFDVCIHRTTGTWFRVGRDGRAHNHFDEPITRGILDYRLPALRHPEQMRHPVMILFS